MEEDPHQYFESETPHFFKIILHDTLQSGKLGFPRSFVRKYESGLCSNKVYLKVTSGDIWEVELYEENGDVGLHNGWQEFVEFYRIKFGYFLVFGYRGNSEFQVLVFDTSTSEIKYPLKSCNKSKLSDGVDPCLLPVKPKININESEMLVDRDACGVNANKKNTNFPQKESGDDDGKDGGVGKSKSLTGQKTEAILRSRDFNSPSQYIRALMQSNHVNSSILHLPQWKLFTEDNNLMVGDVCVLELIDGVEFHFRISILKASEDRNSGLYPGSSAEIPCASTRDRIAKNPTFKLIMTASRIYRTYVDLPRGFAKNLIRKTQVTIFEVAGTFWHVRAKFHSSRRRATFSNGWNKFKMDNSLRVGDVCEFEPVNLEPMVLKVTIHRYSS